MHPREFIRRNKMGTYPYVKYCMECGHKIDSLESIYNYCPYCGKPLQIMLKDFKKVTNADKFEEVFGLTPNWSYSDSGQHYICLSLVNDDHKSIKNMTNWFHEEYTGWRKEWEKHDRKSEIIHMENYISEEEFLKELQKCNIAASMKTGLDGGEMITINFVGSQEGGRELFEMIVLSAAHLGYHGSFRVNIEPIKEDK